LVVEVDGGVHVGREAQDGERARALEGLGYRVIRFTNNEIEKDIHQVVEAIRAALGIAPHYLLVPWGLDTVMEHSISAYRRSDKLRPGPRPELAKFFVSGILSGGGSGMFAAANVRSVFSRTGMCGL
jgi:hypothetical protein